VSTRFEELDWQPTPMGDISLRRRWDPMFNTDVFEVKLDDDFLMSSLFTVAEIEVARLALAKQPGTDLDVAVGGLGLGYTAQTVLDDPRVRSLLVVEALQPVADWHQRHLVPVGAGLTGDPRCRLRIADFFALATSETGLDPDRPGRRFDAVIVDIDHSPRHVLHPDHAAFYQPDGLRKLAGHLKPGGVFSLWSNDPPDDEFTATLSQEFTGVEAIVVSFDNPLQDRESTNTVYLASAPA
jgi:spermidine synthase